jgi:hypothetical protein
MEDAYDKAAGSIVEIGWMALRRFAILAFSPVFRAAPTWPFGCGMSRPADVPS